MNRIVAHFQDGRVLKGFTTCFVVASATQEVTFV